METAQTASVAVEPLPVRRRHDLVLSQTGTGEHAAWTVKDPVSERYFHLRQADYFVFRHLDGKASVEEIQRHFHAAHAPQKLSAEQILDFVQRLFTQGLVQVDKYGLSATILERGNRLRSAEQHQKLSSLLAIRFRGIDPDRWLQRWLPAVNWGFSPVLVVLSSLLCCLALLIVCSEWDRVYRELPSFATFLRSGQIVWFMGTIALVKVLHELAHAFACKRFGGECHELGVMLLALTPCLYCNVSDAWLLRSRWQRIAISGAGIYMEVVIASFCTILWYWTVPGVIHTLCLYLMVISSVSTIFLNGNPLLRYDGYYILSDVVGVPNLRSRAQGLVHSWLNRLFFGASASRPSSDAHVSPIFLGVYGCLSSIYVWFVLFAILWMLYQFAKPYGLESLVVGMGLMLLLSKLVSIGGRVIAKIAALKRLGDLRMWRLGTSITIAISLLAVVLSLELPRRITAPCLIEAAGSRSVFVSSPGRITFIALKSGMQVEQGAELARLSNLDLEREILSLRGKVAQQQKRIELLRLKQSYDRHAAAEIPSANSTLLDYQDQLQNKITDFDRLTLKAPSSGTVLPEREHPGNTTQISELRQQGAQIEMQNEGAWLERGVPLCRIADPNRREAVLYFEQADAVLIAPLVGVTLTTWQTAESVIHGEVMNVAAEPLLTIPPTLLREEAIPFHSDRDGQLTPARPIHEVRVRLDLPGDLSLAPGQTGRAVIHLPAESVFTSLLRVLRQTLTFEI